MPHLTHTGLALLLLAGTAAANEPIRLGELRMVSPTHGYASNGDAAYETKDGGKTFVLMPHAKGELPVFLPDGRIVFFRGGKGTCGDGIGRLAAVDTRHAWGWSCQDDAMGGREGIELDATTDGGRHWRAVAKATPFGRSAIPFMGDKGSLTFADARHGWITVADSCGQGGWGSAELLATRDGGRTFRSIPLPDLNPRSSNLCRDGDVAELAVTSIPPHAVAAWALRSDSGRGAGVWISTNAGATWRALAPIPGTSGQSRYPGQTSISVVSPRLVFARGKDGVLRTWEARRHAWRKVRFVPQARSGKIFFLDARHGWLYDSTDSGFHVWRTVDGGRIWTKLR